MAESFGHNVLAVFDVWEDSRDFLAQVIESGCVPDQEARYLFDQSLTGGADDWHYLIDCARSIQQARHHDQSSLDGRDVLTYVWHIFDGSLLTEPSESWENTDRLIQLAKRLEEDSEIRLPSSPAKQQGVTRQKSRPPPATRKQCIAVSHYWSNELETLKQDGITCPSYPSQSAAWCQKVEKTTSSTSHAGFTRPLVTVRPNKLEPGGISEALNIDVTCDTSAVTKQAGISPYFTLPNTEKKPSPKRPPRGTVSCVPFPPLTSSSFGLVQEKVAHEPFWLLVAITFLIRTTGKQAIPVFYKVKERFPTPSHLADSCNEKGLLDMIRHLGLSAVRIAYLQRYARAFLEQPPTSGMRYKVKNYDRRDVIILPKDVRDNAEDSEMASPAPAGDGEDAEAWEIGHMTKGKYAIDSWRIFCRDELLGRARDWNGEGREAEFQPEWMRVMPDDKELRAYLRWMWMREGWEWDPVTGERVVLRDEMQRAVNEGRVEYDETGGLRILDEVPET